MTATPQSARWPTPVAGQVEVMLLGTYHMANPGQDSFNVDADDVLTPDRQHELETLTDRLERYRPDRIAVEQPADRQTRLDRRYRRYRDGGLRESRTETVQVGFRLADRLDHDRVLAIDHRPDLDERLRGVLSPDPDDVLTPADVPYPLSDATALHRASQAHLDTATVPDHLAWTNREPQLALNHELMFAQALDRADPDLGALVLASWYERNIRAVTTLWNELDRGTERVVVLVGSGHVRVLRHLLAEAPMFCPVSPLPFLLDDADAVSRSRV